MQLMMPGRRSEVPENRFVILGKESEPVRLVLCPRANVRCCQITHVVHVEAKQRAHLRLRQQILHALQAFAAQPIKVDSLFPLDRHSSMSRQCQDRLLYSDFSFDCKALAPLQIRSSPSGQSRLRAVVRTEWAHASLPSASQAHPDRKMRLPRSQTQSPP